MERKEHKKFAWCPECETAFYGTYDTVEDCVETAKTEFYNGTGEYYGVDDRYSPTIRIGIVEDLDYGMIAEKCFDAVMETVKYEVRKFSYGTGNEAECRILSEEAEQKFKQSLMENIMEHLHISPVIRANYSNKKYDLMCGGWVDECNRPIY